MSATGSGGTGSYIYLWFKNGNPTGITTQTFDPGALIASSAFYCAITSGSCGTVNSNTITITVDGNLTASISGGTSPICYNTDPGSMTATGSGGTGSYTYLWFKNGNPTGITTQTYDPGALIASSAFYCSITSGSCGTVNSNTITITVDGNLTASISGGTSPICYNTDPGSMSATGGGGTGSYTYLWYENGNPTGITTQTYDPGVLSLTSSFYCAITSGSCGTVNSNTITITVDGNLTASISGGTSPICYNTDPGSMTATGSGGTGSYTYLWFKNGNPTGITTQTYDPGALIASSAFYCSITSGSCGTVNSNTITITVDGNLTASISGGTSPICYNTDPGSMSATGGEGTGSYTYLWFKNGNPTGITTQTYDPGALIASSAFYCSITSGSCGTVNSNTITITVDGNLTASINGGTSPICYNTDPGSMTATGSGGTGSYTYLWYENGNPTGITTQTYDPGALIASSAFYCAITSGSCGTVNSNTITITVNLNLPVSVSIIADNNPVCSGTTVNYTATPTNGGSSPSYQWKVNGLPVGTNSSTYSYAPLNNDAVTCVLTSDATCPTGNPATSNTINMTVNPLLPVSVSIIADNNPVCSGTTVNYTATPTNGGSSPSYQWKVNGLPVGTNSPTYSYAPLNNDAVTCVLTSDATCPTGNPATSNTINMIVNPLLPVSVSIIADNNPVCSGTTVNYTATPTNGGSSPSYQWKVNGLPVGTNSPTYSYAPLNNDAVTCVLTSDATCPTGNPATSNTINMIVNPLLPVSVSIIADNNPVCSGTTVNYTATPTNGGSSPSYQWKVNGLPVGTNSPTYSYAPLNNDAVTCVLTSDATCPTGNPATSNTITMTVNPLLPVSVSIIADNNPVCSGTTVNYTATPTNGGSSPSYQWKVNGLPVGTNSSTYSYVPLNNDAVTCVLTSDATCPSANPATSNTITMIVNPLLPVNVSIIADNNPVCAGTTVNYTATPTNGGSSPSYQWKVNGLPVGTNSPNYSYIPVNNDVVTCVLTSNATCPTGNPATSNTITMTVNPLPGPTITGPVSVCVNSIGNIYTTQTGMTNYIWSVSAGGTITAGGGTANNTVTVTWNTVGAQSVSVNYTNSNGCTAVSPTVYPVIVNPLQIPTVSGPGLVCNASTGNIYTTQSGMTGYTWTVTGGTITCGNGTASITVTWNLSGLQTVSVSYTTGTGCTAPSPGTMTVVVIPLPTPTITGPNDICAGSTGVIYTTESGMSNYTWSISSGGITTAGAGTNSVTVSWITAGTQTISVSYSNTFGCAAASPPCMSLL